MERLARDAEIERGAEVEQDAGGRKEQTEGDSDPVEQEARLMNQRRLDGLGLDLVLHQPAVLGGVAHEHGHREREGQKREPVERDRDPLRIVLAHVLRQELRRKGQERGEQEHEQIEPVERGVRGAQRTGDRRVLQPDDPDRQEARYVREQRRPLVHDCPQQVVTGALRDAELQDEQGDRDRKDAVAEGLQATERQLIARRGHGGEFRGEVSSSSSAVRLRRVHTHRGGTR